MKNLLSFELYKLVRLPRVWITFGVMAIIMGLINFGVATEGEEVFDILLKPLSEQFLIQGNLINGYLLAYLSLNTLWVHIPVLLVIVTADLVSGEMESGSIRNALCSKYSRGQWLMAKMLAAALYIFAFMLFSGIMMLVPSLLIFGKGDLMIFYGGLQILSEGVVLSRFFGALLFGTIAMLTFALISMMFSVLLRNTLAAILSSLGILVVSTLLQTFAFGLFDSWKPMLFTFHMAQWQLFFAQTINNADLLKSMMVLLLHMALAIGVSLWRFNKIQITE